MRLANRTSNRTHAEGRPSRFPPNHDPLNIFETDEGSRLSEVSNLTALFAGGRSGRTVLIAERIQKANDWYEQCIRDVAGPAPPPEWERYKDVACGTLVLYRQIGGHYSPATGAIVADDGAVFSTSISEAKYLIRDISGLPCANAAGEQVKLALPSGEQHLNKIMVTLPWGGLHNYGHFVLDCLPAVALLASLKELSDHQFVFPPLKPWQRRHLDLLDIRGAELSEDWCSADEIVFTSCMNHFMHWPQAIYNTLVDAQTARSYLRGEPRSKLYIRRRDREKRLFVSEMSLQRQLTDIGFQAICPEDLSVDDQIATFRSARIVVGCSGAALANTIYCPAGTVVVEIQPSLARGIWVRNICALRSLRWRPYFCHAQPAPVPLVIGGAVRIEHGITFDIDIDDFLSFLTKISV